MASIGDIWTDRDSYKRYKCTAMITVSPTLINRELKSYVWEPIPGMGGESSEPPKTIVLEDENGNKIVAVLVDGEIDFTATPNDIREGMVAATDEGVTVGEKYIPSYLTTAGVTFIMPGETFSIKLADNELYKYTKFQGLICPYDSSVSKSVACEKVVINDNLYDVLSTVSINEIQLDSESKTIEMGITNDTESLYLIRYFTYKEVY